jgi:hypothetical protein
LRKFCVTFRSRMRVPRHPSGHLVMLFLVLTVCAPIS